MRAHTDAEYRQVLANHEAGSDPKLNADYKWSRVQARVMRERMLTRGISTENLPAAERIGYPAPR